MTTREEALARTDETREVTVSGRVYFVAPTSTDPNHNYLLSRRSNGGPITHAQTLNLNGAHPVSFADGSEIGAHPGCVVTLVIDPTLNGPNGGPHVWIYPDTDD